MSNPLKASRQVKRRKWRRERRAKQRFPSQLPIFITAGSKEIQGMTRDIGSEGVFFHVRDWPLQETRIEFRIGLPLGTIPAKSVSIMCKGWVLRVENEGEKTGVAATLDGITFVNATSL